MRSIHAQYLSNGDQSIMAWARGGDNPNHDEIKIGSSLDVYHHALMARLTDRCGFYSKKATLELVDKLERFEPDLVHLHVLHGYYINVPILFDWLKKNACRVKWTQHDCWAFTGHCCNFESVGCQSWKSGCGNCIQKKVYPKSMLLDASELNWEEKREIFTSLDNLELICPSNWMSNLISESYLADIPRIVERNSIDLSDFKRTPSSIAVELGASGKKIVLAVASTWTTEKGIDDVFWLSECLDASWRVVMVGLNDRQMHRLPSNVIGVKRTESKHDLVKLYSAAKVFVNPTYEDNYPTVNLEAQRCGAPVVCYDTGGCRETLDASLSPFRLVKTGDRESLLSAIMDCSREENDE